MNTKSNIAIGQSHNLIHTNWYEFPTQDPDELEIWCYTDNISYAPGESVNFHTSGTAKTYNIEIHRDGANLELAYQVKNLPGKLHDTPADCSQTGCGWPVAHTWEIPVELRSGGYIVLTSATNEAGEQVEHQHFFVVRSAEPGKTADILLVCATNTWNAYNGWGGSSHYEGNCKGPDVNEMSPVLSTQRPWAKGQIWLPVGAPRQAAHDPHEKGSIIRYRPFEWAYTRGFSKYYNAAGWAMYERHFVAWAENNDYQLDFATQQDLHFQPELLQDYKCVVFVGHDEYWSAEMRDAVDTYVDDGGQVARFGANYIWQIRLEDEGNTQVCYKYYAREQDPVADTEPHRMTGAWEDPRIDRPGTMTFGLNGCNGIYAGVGGFSPRHSRGYTVYRPEHWVFGDTDLYFGDILGAEAQTFAYEVDSVEFTFRDGLPYPTFTDRAPETLEILAMGVSSNVEEDHGSKGNYLYVGDSELAFVSEVLKGDVSDESLAKTRYGAGMMAVFTRGDGSVFNAGSCEWINGLRLCEPMTEQITKNVLDQFTR